MKKILGRRRRHRKRHFKRRFRLARRHMTRIARFTANNYSENIKVTVNTVMATNAAGFAFATINWFNYYAGSAGITYSGSAAFTNAAALFRQFKVRALSMRFVPINNVVALNVNTGTSVIGGALSVEHASDFTQLLTSATSEAIFILKPDYKMLTPVRIAKKYIRIGKYIRSLGLNWCDTNGNLYNSNVNAQQLGIIANTMFKAEWTNVSTATTLGTMVSTWYISFRDRIA